MDVFDEAKNGYRNARLILDAVAAFGLRDDLLDVFVEELLEDPYELKEAVSDQDFVETVAAQQAVRQSLRTVVKRFAKAI